jgi:hypothetical protein
VRKVNADDKRQAAELIEFDGEAANPASGAADEEHDPPNTPGEHVVVVIAPFLRSSCSPPQSSSASRG